MRARLILASVAAAATIALLVACENTVAPGEVSVTPGSSSVIAVDNYDGSEDCPQITPYISEASLTTSSALQASGWNPVSLYDPPSMTSAMFTFYMTENALFYFGHGAAGVVAFPGGCSYAENGDSIPSTYYWGIGNLGGDFPKATGSLPSASSLYWMFLFSSDTVAPDASQDPTDASNPADQGYVANPWEPLFYQSGLPLRGMYGYWQSLGSCDDPESADNGTRNCDVYANNNPGVASTLLPMLDSNNTSTTIIPDAWEQSNEANDESGSWSEELDANSNDDFFTKSPAVSRANSLEFFDQETGAPVEPVVAVSGKTGTLTPFNLVNESLNVGGAVATGDSDFSAGALSYSYPDNGAMTTFTSATGLEVTSYPGLSGGVTYSSMTLHNPMTISQSAAEAAAVDFINNSFGMPGDAVLADTLSMYTLETSGSSILTGYEFVWNHSSGTMYGGDAIKVDVEDYRKATTICTEMTDPDPPLKPICIQHSTTYSDVANVSFGYRLWRSAGSAAAVTRTDYTAGRTTIDAYTASLALPDPSDVTGYNLGYWTGPIGQASGIAEPAWIYGTSSGRVYAVDAGSGAVIGTEMQ